MPRRPIRLIILALAAAVLALILVVAARRVRVGSPEAFLADVRDADRVVVDLNVWAESPDEARPWVQLRKITIDGADAARALVAALRVERVSSKKCECHGDLLLRFLRGEQKLAVYTLFHGSELAAPGRRVVLTPESQAAMRAWLTEHGCPSPEEAVDERVRTLREAETRLRGTMPAAE